MQKLRVRHETVYHYNVPVHFGEHTLMLRPRDSHDLKVLEASLHITPAATLRWYHDVFGNSVAVARFWEASQELRFLSMLFVQHFESPAIEGLVEATSRPGSSHYSPDLEPDLAPTVEPQHDDPGGVVAAWTNRFVQQGTVDPGRFRTLVAMAQAIHDEFTWEERPEPGVQDPAETLHSRTGSCRDFSLLMMEAARRLGFAARFVSGYLYDRGLAADGGELVGGGATHAWLEVFLPGAGWVDFDPTNGGVGNANLIRVAVAREPSQAIPVSGVYYGPDDAVLGMEVTVEVTAEQPGG